MTWKEMYDDLAQDAKKVQIRIDKIYPKAVKFFKKTRSFPSWYIDEYKIPATNNQYIIFFMQKCEKILPWISWDVMRYCVSGECF